jgi:hypothetical protein
MTKQHLRRLNARLAREFGRTPFGGPNLKWAFGGDLKHAYRVPGFDFKKQASGLVVAEPKYEVGSINPLYAQQWVICRWEAPISEAEWRTAFGSGMEWPREGEYYPTNVALDRGTEPSDAWTDAVIAAEKKRRAKSLADHQANIERECADGERHARNLRRDIIDDACTAFGNVPGRKMGTSFPSVTPVVATP